MLKLNLLLVCVAVLFTLLLVTPVLCAYPGEIFLNSYQVEEHETPDLSKKDAKAARKAAKRLSKRIARWGMNVDAYLERYGYLPQLPALHPLYRDTFQTHSRAERKEAIRLFQEFSGIKQTGKLNKKTVQLMKEPRCSLPDIRLKEPTSVLRNFHFYHYYPRWRRSLLTWRASKRTRKVSPLGQWKTFKKAFETWSAVSGVRFVYTRGDPDINIQFERGNHGDGRWNAFDFKGGQVGHAFGPGDYSISGDVHLDDDDEWTLEVNPSDGVNLLGVTIHQIGHALGLQHSSHQESVMNPIFSRTRLDLILSDVKEIQRLYGPNPEMNEEAFFESHEKSTLPPKVCKVSMQDIEQGPDGNGYIFKETYVRTVDKNGGLMKTPRKPQIGDIYPGGPKRVDAVAYWTEIKRTYMFHNDTVWRFSRFDLDHGYPKVISGRQMPETPRAAAVVRDQYGVTRVFLFGVSVFWEWDTARDEVRKGYPLNTAEYFEDLPPAPSGATRWKDGYVYFFKGDKFYKVHPGSYRVMHGYPKPMPPDWLKGVC